MNGNFATCSLPPSAGRVAPPHGMLSAIRLAMLLRPTSTTYNDKLYRAIRNFRRMFLPLLFVPLTAMACGSNASSNEEAEEGLPSDDGTSSENGEPSNGGDSDSGSEGPSNTEPPAPPCDDAQTAAIQASFEGDDAPKDVDAVALVKDPSCGERYFTRGPSHIPATASHVIASNTKTYVASLILLLADDGLLKLDDPISKWLEKVPGGDAITVRHALNHTSGIYNYADSLVFRAQATLGKKYTPQELIGLGFNEKVYAAPGAEYHYSNTNYVILGRIAEKVAGKPVEEQLRERILTPIGAKNTYFYGKEPLPADIAFGKTFLGGNGLNFWDPSASWCAGSYIATPADLAHWVELRGSGKFHSANANKELFNGITVQGDAKYGAGLIMYPTSHTHAGGPALGHAGDLAGYHSYGLYFPEKKTTVVLIVDNDAGPTGGFPLGSTYREELYFAITVPLFGPAPSDDAGAP